MDDDFPFTVGYFRLARNTSKLSDHRVQVGAVLSKKKPLIACSNKAISHPIHANGSDLRNSLHAEIRCLLHTSHEDLNGSEIYVYRETAKGHPALARPCEYCMEALKERGIKKIYYSIGTYPFYAWERI